MGSSQTELTGKMAKAPVYRDKKEIETKEVSELSIRVDSMELSLKEVAGNVKEIFRMLSNTQPVQAQAKKKVE